MTGYQYASQTVTTQLIQHMGEATALAFIRQSCQVPDHAELRQHYWLWIEPDPTDTEYTGGRSPWPTLEGADLVEYVFTWPAGEQA